MAVLATVFAHPCRVGLDVAGFGPRVLQGRVQQPQQAMLGVPQFAVGSSQCLLRARWVAGATENSPGLGDEVDSAFGL